MKRQLLIGLMAATLLIGCGPHKPSVAEQREAKRQQDSTNLAMQEKSLAYTDSLLQSLLPTADSLLALFDYKKNEKYEDNGYYIHKHLQTAGLGQRIYLQAFVTDNLKTVVRSMYFGTKLEHNAITLIADSVSSRFEGEPHYFEAEGNHEMVTLSNNDAVALLQFVNAYADKRIKVRLSGKRNYAYYLNAKDKHALLETLRLQVVMSDIKRLEEQQRQSSLQIETYKRRLEK